MTAWKKCKASKPHFRPIFKLALAPSPQKCQMEWGYNTDAHHLGVANAVARQVVESAGFEVFDPYPAGLHAPFYWYNEHGKDNQHSDALADAITQMLVNQMCNGRQSERHGVASRVALDSRR